MSAWLRLWIHSARLAVRCTPFQRRIAAETVVSLIGARVVAWLPFRWVAPRLGVLHHESPTSDSPADVAVADRVLRVVEFSAARLPWESTCFVRALAAHAMLSRRGLDHTLYLGVHSDGDQLMPHAWLRCGPVVVTGGPLTSPWTIVAAYAWPEGSIPQ